MRFLIVLLFFASSVSAQPLAVTNTFSNNTVADAEDINQNFTDIVNGVNAKLRIDNASTYSTALGSEALLSNTGFGNTAVGYKALYYNTTGFQNTAIGEAALFGNTEGHANTACGSNALVSNTAGFSNTANGFNALRANTSGYSNTAIGFHALSSNGTGFFNTAIGYFADVTAGNLINATAIGYNAKVDASNTIQLGNAEITDAFIGRREGVGLGSDANLHLQGKVTSGAVTYPNTDGSAGQVLTTDGNGVVSWAAAPDTLGSLNCTAEQLPKWNGNAWACAPDNDSLAARSCDLGQVLLWEATGWECSSGSYAFNAMELEEQVASLQEQLQSQQEELLAIVQSQQEQIAQLQKMVEHQFAMN